jgi:addiction module RelE/StbE family toxin
MLPAFLLKMNASIELRHIFEYFNQRNKCIQYSLKLLSEIDDLVAHFSDNELIGRLTSNKTTRIIPIREYLIFYEIHQGYIQIISFWDNRLIIN